MNKKILPAIETRKKYYNALDIYMHKMLDMMIEAGEEISVSAVARKCDVTRVTVYKHPELYEKIRLHRDLLPPKGEKP